MDPDLVVVYRAKNELMANTIRDLLVQDNIAAATRAFRIVNSLSSSASNVYGNNFGAWGEVLVDRTQADSAVALIEGFLANSEAPLSDEELEALALAAGSPEAEPGIPSSPSEDSQMDRTMGSAATWLRKTHELFWTLTAGPHIDQKP
jgi:hypothetical protein